MDGLSGSARGCAGLSRCVRSRRRRRALIDQSKPPRPHRLGDILQRLRTHIVEDNIDLAADLPLRVIGNADAARLGDPFKARRDIDAVAEDIVVVDDDVADVNADAKFDPRVLRHVGVLLGHGALDFDRATRRIDGAREFDQHAVAGGLDDAAAMRGDGGIDEGSF